MDPSSDGSRGRDDQWPVIYFLWAVLFLDGILRLTSRKDLPFGILLVSLPVMGLALWLFKNHPALQRSARMALVAMTVAAGITEVATGRVVEGVALLALPAIAMLGLASHSIHGGR